VIGICPKELVITCVWRKTPDYLLKSCFRTNPFSRNAEPQRSVRVSGFARTLRWGFALRLNCYHLPSLSHTYCETPVIGICPKELVITCVWRKTPTQKLFRTNPFSRNAELQRSVRVSGFARTLRWSFALRLNCYHLPSFTLAVRE
jgi:hypothetical protein